MPLIPLARVLAGIPRPSLPTVLVLAAAGVFAGVVLVPSPRAAAASVLPNLLTFPNGFGQGRTFNTRGILDPDNPFFQSLGANGRSCVTCHAAEDGWTITPASVRQRFESSDGLEPLFRTNDGSNCAGADTSTLEARRMNFSLLLNRGLIRVELPVPEGAEFFIEAVDDPYGCGADLTKASLYRRPLPATNLQFLSAVMWDGRESPGDISLTDALLSQARDATRGHAEAATDPTDEELRRIVSFETGLFTAQSTDRAAGGLASREATGGPITLSRQPFFIGINDPLGQNPTGAPFDPNAFTLFRKWTALEGDSGDPGTAARKAIARGEALFNTRPIEINGVSGLNDELGVGSIAGTCTTCHDTPNVGNHSVKAPLDIGLTDPGRRTPDMPLYTLRNLATGEVRQTTDPGRAMITGKWKDIGRFKGPVLRGLAARAPYFHNGSAATLADVVDFYDRRFNLNLTASEKADLIAFLAAL